MKLSDVPKRALTASPTPIPVKTVEDWDALYQMLLKRGFVIIESHDLRRTASGAEESVPVKAFNNHVRLSKRARLITKRISETRWYCTLSGETK